MRFVLAMGLAAWLGVSCGDDSATDGAGSTSTTGAGASGATGPSAAATTSSKASAGSTSAASGDTSSGASGSGGAASCMGTKPDETNTGVPPGTTLTVVDDDVVVDEDGATIDAQDIHGFLRIEASHVTVKRTIVRGYATDATTAIIRIESGSDILLEDVEVAAAEPSVDVDGVSGDNFTARRLHIHGGVDGMKLGSNTTVECSYIHDLAAFDSDPNQNGGPTHNDAIQILAGTNIHLVNNQLLAITDDNSAIQVTQDFGAVSDLHFENNWADGGGCTFNLSHKGGASLDDVFSSGNRFGRSSFYDCPILKSTQTSLTSTADVYDDDGSPVPIQTHD